MNETFPSYLAKTIFSLFILFAPLASKASCSGGWLEAETSQFLLWVESDDDCHGKLMISWWVKKIIDGKPTVVPTDEQTVVPFDQECVTASQNGEATDFSCKPGITPISGAKYKRFRIKDYQCTIDGNTFPLPAYAYKCIDGCKENTLKILKQVVEACD